MAARWRLFGHAFCRGSQIVNTAVSSASASPAHRGILEWLTSTDHEHFGILYMGTCSCYFLVAGLLALVIRAQLSQPEMTLVGPHQYAQIFTLHGTAMIFLFVVPFALGLANFLIPLQIGAPDMAFPRLNAFTYWLFFFAGLTIFSGVFVNGGAAATGWYAYAPLSEINVSTGGGQDLWIIGLLMSSVSGILTAVNFITTIFLYRAPGMTMWRLPDSQLGDGRDIPPDSHGLPVVGGGPCNVDIHQEPAFRRAVLRRNRGGKPRAVSTPVLVFRTPRSLHYDPAVLWRDQ